MGGMAASCDLPGGNAEASGAKSVHVLQVRPWRGGMAASCIMSGGQVKATEAKSGTRVCVMHLRLFSSPVLIQGTATMV